MKKITLWLFTLLFCMQLKAQISAYTFSQSNGTYTEITGGTVLGIPTNDDTSFNANPIGFSFTYNGVNYTQFSVNSNGFIAMGATVSSSYVSISGGATNNIIAPFNDDLQGIATTGELSYQLSGIAPNQVLTIQWKNYRHFSGTGDNYNFQIKLYQTSNLIDFIYGSITQNATNRNHQVGLRGISNTNFINRTTITDWNATTAGASNTANCLLTATIFPASGLKFTWTPPSCSSPSGFTATSILATTATINWSSQTPAPSVGYEYYYSTVNTAPTVAGTATTSSTANLTGLTANTLYYVWLRSDCGGGIQSAWSSSSSFITACNSFTAPWTYDVETAGLTTNSVILDCWSSIPTNTTASYRWNVDGAGGTPTSPNTGPTGANSGVKYFYVEASSGVAAAVAELYTPLVDVSSLTDASLQFYYHMFGNNMGELHVDIFDGSVWVNDVDVVIGQQQTATTQPWRQRIVSLSAFSGTIQARFRAIRGNGVNGDISIDDITFDEAPACLPPTNLTVSNISPTTVDLNWIENGSSFDWEYVIQAPGSGIPTGNGVTIDANPYNVTALTSNTAYEVYIRSVCSVSEKSTWVGPVTFRTSCVNYTIPYFEGFESGYTQDVSVTACLSQESVTGTEVWTANTSSTTYNRTPRTGAWNAYLRYSNEDWMFIPINLVGGTSYTISFYARQDGATATNSNVSASYGTAASAAGMTTVIVPATGIINGNYQQIVGSFTPATSGTYYVGIKGFINFSPWYISLDDISIDVTPACQDPFGLTVTNLSNSSANLTWSATSGNYEYVLDNIAADPTGAGTAIATEGYNATGLIASTAYYFHVRTNCGSGTFSNWSTIMFTTLATPPANDNCSNAQTLTPGGNYAGNITDGTNAGATAGSEPAPTTCFGYSGGDIWFSVVVPASGSITIETGDSSTGATGLDTVFAVYSGACGSLTQVGCDDDGAATGAYSLLSLSGRTPGEVLLVRVYQYNNTSTGAFGIAAYDASLSTATFDATSFKAYPNPVKDILTFEYTTSISSIRIVNLLGQEVLSRNINANTTKIDMSQLNSGAYIVNVVIDDAVQSIKVIKE